MGFTKAQRLKGLKKQLRNLGYTVSREGVPPKGDFVPEEEMSMDTEDRGAKLVMALRARDEAW